ncbi:hypothetical protein KYK30_14375 [Shinella yambaruensis]|uniref:Uncharacterized protein n=1 Tax=Shinella yambaruensis TaxID=415996 RepID=A0ABQ5ZDQ5_9HYPH|nr:hypothetical protein [Shinella yambaruensis]MCJ8024442.1 hypothetical protein [Shinella yambaruensis]MCU7980884.1 hypothetical protein [Shinella yambaruensis]GLR49745.1 hypothetical protein GCM10007923_09500 [Shinella yambaruensis]
MPKRNTVNEPSPADLSEAYLQWLHMEARILRIELYGDNYADREWTPCNTFTQHYHFKGGDWRALPQPSTRATSVLRIVGADIPRHKTAYDRWRAAVAALDGADKATAGKGDLSSFYHGPAHELKKAEALDAVDTNDVMLRIAGAIYWMTDGDDPKAAENLLMRALRGLAAMTSADTEAMRLDFYVSSLLEDAA